jgi:hypothetical protein
VCWGGFTSEEHGSHARCGSRVTNQRRNQRLTEEFWMR